MKKQYISPEQKIINIGISSIICQSGSTQVNVGNKYDSSTTETLSRDGMVLWEED